MNKSIKKEDRRSASAYPTGSILPGDDKKTGESSAPPLVDEVRTQGDISAVSSRTGEYGGEVALYARVSTGAQAKNDTVESQLAALRKFSDQHGYSFSENDVFVDEGYSGSTLVRPSLENLRDLAQEGVYRKVIVHSPDRLARSYAYQFILLEELRSNGCLVEFINNPGGDSPEEQLLVQMQGMIAEYERAKIHERTRRGKLHKMRNGEFLHGIRVFGYDYVRRTGETPAHYKINSDEAEIVKWIFETYLNEKLSLRGVAMELGRRGVSTARGGSKWDPATIRGMLKNSMYTGTAHVHKWRAEAPAYRSPSERAKFRRYDKTLRKPRPRDEWFSFGAPRIVGDDLFELCAERLKTAKQKSKRRTKGEYLLQGLLECDACGEIIVAQRGFYQCKHSIPSRALRDMVCVCSNQKRIRSTDLDSVIWDEVFKILKSPSRLKEIYQRLNRRKCSEDGGKSSPMRKKKALLETQLKKINELYIMGAIGKEEHKSKYSDKKEKLSQIEKTILQLRQENISEENMMEMLSTFKFFTKSIQSSLNNADFAAKRRGVEEIVKLVVVGDRDITLNYAVPLRRKKGTLCLRSQS